MLCKPETERQCQCWPTIVPLYTLVEVVTLAQSCVGVEGGWRRASLGPQSGTSGSQGFHHRAESPAWILHWTPGETRES